MGIAGIGAGVLSAGIPLAPASAREVETAAARPLDPSSVYVSADDFPGIYPDGSADSTQGLANAIATVPPGGLAVVGPGTYLVSGPINRARTDIRVHGYGATLIQNAKAPVFAASGTWGQVFAVSQLRLVSAPGNDPGMNATSVTHELVTQGTPSYREGDLVKVLSNDLIPEARNEDGGLASRLGEYAVVMSSSGSVTRLVGRLREPFAANIRVASAPQQSMEIRGFTVRVSDAGPSTPGGFGPMISLVGLHRPVVADVRCPRSTGTVVFVGGCFGYIVDNLDVGYAVNFTGSAPYQLGYAVTDASCCAGTVRDSTMRYVRHAFTDDTPRIGAASNEIWKYGRSFGARIINCASFGTSSDSFDTHHASENISFVDCSASNGGAGAAAFGLRGKSNSVVNATITSMELGVAVFTETTRGGESWGHRIDGASMTNIAKTAIAVSINTSGHPNAGVRETRPNVYLNDIVVRDARWVLDCVNATVDMRAGRFSFGPAAAGDVHAVVRNRNSRVVVSDCDFDAIRSQAGRIEFCVSLRDSGQTFVNETVLRRITVLQDQASAVKADRFLWGAGHHVVMDDVVFEYPFRTMPGTVEGTSNLNWRCRSDPTVPRSDLSSAFHYFDSDLARDLGPLWMTDEMQLVVQLQTGSAQHLLAPFPPGRRRGQSITFFASGSGSASIAHGPAARTINVGNITRVLRQNMFATYIWDASRWRQR